VGECSGNAGQLTCVDGSEVDTCDPLAGAAPEVCNDTLDNDCDGSTDAADVDCQEQLIDLDIVRFQVHPKRVSLSKGKKPIEAKLTVKNDGVFNSQTRDATLIGTQDGVTVYFATIPVSDEVGDGRSTFTFPACSLPGPCPGVDPSVLLSTDDNIHWEVVIDDDDTDVDVATATTTVVP
jgi:hypothetical protein